MSVAIDNAKAADNFYKSYAGYLYKVYDIR